MGIEKLPRPTSGGGSYPVVPSRVVPANHVPSHHSRCPGSSHGWRRFSKTGPPHYSWCRNPHYPHCIFNAEFALRKRYSEKFNFFCETPFTARRLVQSYRIAVMSAYNVRNSSTRTINVYVLLKLFGNCFARSTRISYRIALVSIDNVRNGLKQTIHVYVSFKLLGNCFAFISMRISLSVRAGVHW